MKIAFLNIYSGRVLRGSEIFVHELASRLSAKHTVWVFQTGTTHKGSYKTITVASIPIVSHQQGFLLSFMYTLIVLYFTLRCLPKLLKEKFDWVVPINGRFQVPLCRLLRFVKGTKILITGHSGVGIDDRLNIILGNPDLTIALSQNAAEWSRNIKSNKKVEYIPNGIDTKMFSPRVTPALLSLRKPIILCVAALVEYKRIHLLIEAVSRLKDASLLLIGEGPLKAELVSLAKKLLIHRFLHKGYIPHENMSSYYNAVDVFSLPSEKYESFGLVYLEALACNIPVIAPDDENRREIVGSGGLYCDVTNTFEYARLIQKALATNFGNKPRLQALKYSWEIISKRYEQLLSATL